MQIDKHNRLKEEPHLSGAYIRSLVKQLTSSRTKDPMNPKDRGCVDDDGFSGQNMTKFGEGLSEKQQSQQPQQPQQHKKQVRRRLHTSRPYQERLLNMAEARREIVAALKFHRASMKKANEQQQQQNQQENHQQSSLPGQILTAPCFEQEGKIKSRRNPRIYPSNMGNFSNYLDSFSCSSFSHAPPPPPPPPHPFSWSTPPNLITVVYTISRNAMSLVKSSSPLHNLHFFICLFNHLCNTWKLESVISQSSKPYASQLCCV